MPFLQSNLSSRVQDNSVDDQVDHIVLQAASERLTDKVPWEEVYCSFNIVSRTIVFVSIFYSWESDTSNVLMGLPSRKPAHSIEILPGDKTIRLQHRVFVRITRFSSQTGSLIQQWQSGQAYTLLYYYLAITNEREDI